MSNNRLDRKTVRRMEAEERVKARSERSDEEQLAYLEDRGHPNCEEAERLRTKLYGAPMFGDKR